MHLSSQRRTNRPALILVARRAAALCAVSAAAVACGTPTGREEDGDTRACYQTYEFGNYGCVDIVGQVVGTAGQPLAGISVGPGAMSPSTGLNTVYDDTDADGRFGFRLVRYAGAPPSTGPDTVSVYVRAADPRSAGVNVPATVRDSVLVLLTVTPIGKVPAPVSVTIRLPTP